MKPTKQTTDKGPVKTYRQTRFGMGIRVSQRKEKTMKHSKAHPGFGPVAKGIAQKMGIPMENASAILAKSTRNASAAAKKNPRLKRVKGK